MATRYPTGALKGKLLCHRSAAQHSAAPGAKASSCFDHFPRLPSLHLASPCLALPGIASLPPPSRYYDPLSRTLNFLSSTSSWPRSSHIKSDKPSLLALLRDWLQRDDKKKKKRKASHFSHSVWNVVCRPRCCIQGCAVHMSKTTGLPYVPLP